MYSKCIYTPYYGVHIYITVFGDPICIFLSYMPVTVPTLSTTTLPHTDLLLLFSIIKYTASIVDGPGSYLDNLHLT